MKYVKYISALSFLILTVTVFAEPRPMTIQLVDDPSFGRVAYVSCFARTGENLVFKWSGDLNSPFKYLASSGTVQDDGNYIVSAPGHWYTGHAFISCDAAPAEARALLVAKPSFVAPALGIRFEKSSTPKKLSLLKRYLHRDERKGSELLLQTSRKIVVKAPPLPPTIVNR